MKLPPAALAFALSASVLGGSPAFAQASAHGQPDIESQDQDNSKTRQPKRAEPVSRLSEADYDLWDAGHDYAVEHGPHVFSDSHRVNSPSNQVFGALQRKFGGVLGSEGNRVAQDACITSGHLAGRRQSDDTVYGRQVDPIIQGAIDAEQRGDLQARDRGFINAGRIIVQYENHKPAVGANCKQRALDGAVNRTLNKVLGGFHF